MGIIRCLIRRTHPYTTTSVAALIRPNPTRISPIRRFCASASHSPSELVPKQNRNSPSIWIENHHYHGENHHYHGGNHHYGGDRSSSEPEPDFDFEFSFGKIWKMLKGFAWLQVIWFFGGVWVSYDIHKKQLNAAGVASDELGARIEAVEAHLIQGLKAVEEEIKLAAGYRAFVASKYRYKILSPPSYEEWKKTRDD